MPYYPTRRRSGQLADLREELLPFLLRGFRGLSDPRLDWRQELGQEAEESLLDPLFGTAPTSPQPPASGLPTAAQMAVPSRPSVAPPTSSFDALTGGLLLERPAGPLELARGQPWSPSMLMGQGRRAVPEPIQTGKRELRLPPPAPTQDFPREGTFPTPKFSWWKYLLEDVVPSIMTGAQAGEMTEGSPIAAGYLAAEGRRRGLEDRSLDRSLRQLLMQHGIRMQERAGEREEEELGLRGREIETVSQTGRLGHLLDYLSSQERERAADERTRMTGMFGLERERMGSESRLVVQQLANEGRAEAAQIMAASKQAVTPAQQAALQQAALANYTRTFQGLLAQGFSATKSAVLAGLIAGGGEVTPKFLFEIEQAKDKDLEQLLQREP